MWAGPTPPFPARWRGFEARQPFVVPLSAKRRLIAPSHPGFGKSGLPDWLDSVDDIAHLYLELMDRLGCPRLRRSTIPR